MKSLSFLNFKTARRVISSGYGRRPNVHWKILFIFGVLFVIVSLVISGFVFWWGIKDQADTVSGSESNHSFNRKQFESVIEYFELRASRFEKNKEIVVPVDPS